MNNDNYYSKYTAVQINLMYPTIDAERLGWGLLMCVWVYLFGVAL